MSERNAHALPHGYRLGHYVLEDVLGSGGFGITYRARDLQHNLPVAIKELMPTHMVTRVGTQVMTNHSQVVGSWEAAKQSFREEAEKLLSCDHPNVLKVYCTFPSNGTVYMVTRYEEGMDLEKWAQHVSREGKRMSEEFLQGLLMAMLSALEKVHEVGLVHRDVKPSNIYLTKKGVPVLLDFGSARHLVFKSTIAVTAVLTAGYAPFEQYVSARQGPWTDVYALGAVMYRLITGRIPPDAISRKDRDTCLNLGSSAYARHYSPALLRGIDAALCMDVRQRPQSATAWKQFLLQSTREPTGTVTPTHRTYTEQPQADPPRGPVTTVVSEPVTYPTRGLDICGDVPVEEHIALLGGVIQTNIGGQALLVMIPPVTPNGQVIRLTGVELQRGGRPIGNIYIRVVHVRTTRPPRRESNPYWWLSVIFPGFGSLPGAAFVQALLYTFSTLGCYILAVAYWSRGEVIACIVAALVALFMHLIAIGVAVVQGRSRASLHAFPSASMQWVGFAVIIVVFLLEIAFFSTLRDEEMFRGSRWVPFVTSEKVKMLANF